MVDGGGNGDYSTIQAAITAAHAEAPTATERWLVLVGPGEYEESLTLYDYVDISGITPGFAARVVAPTGQNVIATVANCWLSNLYLSGQTDPVIQVNVAAIELKLDTVRISESTADIGILKISAAATVELRNCDFAGAGNVLRVGAGTLKAYNSKFSCSAASTYYALQVDGGTVEMNHSIIENTVAGPGVYFSANPTSGKILHCTVRKASGTNSVDCAGASAAVVVAGTLHNGTIDADVGVATGNDTNAGI
jgi:hypothetical protein